MNWFELLTGIKETSPHAVRQELSVEDDLVHSLGNGKTWICGRLEIPNLAELRGRVAPIQASERRRLTLREVIADVQKLHCDPDNSGAMFQVASQFNLLEMVSPNITPEQGVGRYERDRTQGPACAIAAGAGHEHSHLCGSIQTVSRLSRWAMDIHQRNSNGVRRDDKK